MPPDLDIDQKSSLANTMPHYAEQLILCTGQEDWSSRIEDEAGGTGEFVRGVRDVLGMGKGAKGTIDVCTFHLIPQYHASEVILIVM